MSAGTSLFAAVSRPLEYDQVQSLDLVLLKNARGYLHIGLILERDGLKIVQSTPDTVPTGISLSSLRLEKDGPIFADNPDSGTNWNMLWLGGQIEFRRPTLPFYCPVM